jgi:hypothetical protein
MMPVFRRVMAGRVAGRPRLAGGEITVIGATDIAACAAGR